MMDLELVQRTAYSRKVSYVSLRRYLSIELSPDQRPTESKEVLR